VDDPHIDNKLLFLPSPFVRVLRKSTIALKRRAPLGVQRTRFFGFADDAERLAGLPQLEDAAS
jgi:hypothetical protein